MSTDTPDTDPDEAARQRARIALMLRSYGDTLEELITRFDAAEPDSGAPAAKLLGEVRYWLKQLNEAEKDLNKGGQSNGNAAENQIDLDHARAELRCRLARLRRCGNARGVSDDAGRG